MIPFKLETAAKTAKLTTVVAFRTGAASLAPPTTVNIRELRQSRRRRHENWNNFFYIVLRAKQLCPCITLFSTYPWHPLHDYDVKPLECDVSWRTGACHDEFSSLFLNLDKVLKNQTPGVIAFIWQIESVQIDAIKFERTQIHFLGDVSMLSPSS